MVSIPGLQINQTKKKMSKNKIGSDLNGLFVSIESIRVASQLGIAISDFEIDIRIKRVFLNRLLKIREGLVIVFFPKERKPLRIETLGSFFFSPLPFSKAYLFANLKPYDPLPLCLQQEPFSLDITFHHSSSRPRGLLLQGCRDG